MKKISLDELCTYDRGLSIPRGDTDISYDIPYLHYGDIYKKYDFRIDLNKELDNIIKINEDSDFGPRHMLFDGDIVYTLTSETVDDLGHSTLIINKGDITFVAGMETTIIRIKDPSVVLPAYLNYLFQSDLFKRKLRQYVTGMKVYRVHPKDLLRIKINLPDLETQLNTVGILDSISDKINTNQTINDYLAQIVRAEYCNIMSFAEGEKVPFSTIISIGSGGTPKTSTKEYWGGEIPFFSPKDVPGIYVFDTEKYISEKGLYNCNSALYPKNTIFITARGTVGRITMAARDMAMNQSCYAIIGKKSDQQYYIHQTCLDLVDSIRQKSNGAVFDAINAKDLEQENITKPDKNVIERFELFAAPIYDLIHINGKNISTLTRIRDYLLPKLISGDIDVTDLDLSN